MKNYFKHLGFLVVLLILFFLSFFEKSKMKNHPISGKQVSLQKNSTKPESNDPPFLAAFNTPIDFYGIVLDQHGKPVVGAKVRGFTLSLVKSPELLTKTDKEGKFSIRTNGGSMSVRVSRAGYYDIRGGDILKPSLQDFDFGLENGGQKYVPDAAKPTLFQLRKEGNAVPLYIIRGQVKIPRDGTPETIESTKQGKLSLKVSCRTLEDTTQPPNSHYDWRCEISVEGGLLQKVQDINNFIAPDSDYQPSAVIDMPKELDNSKWKNSVSFYYWLKFNDGSYGRILFEMFAGGDHFATVEGFRNPRPGDRNVEAKVVQEWD